MSIDFEALRQELNNAVYTVLTKYEKLGQSITKDGLTITPAEALQRPYVHKWPQRPHQYNEGRWYDVSGKRVPAEGLRVLVARTKVDSWGKPQRSHVVVFGKLHTQEEGKQLTPYVAFTADDHGTFAGVIPNPVRLHESLKPNNPLPAQFVSAVVKRNDELFDSVKHGPALRLVVQPDNEIAMVEHGLWVASFRKRFKPQ
jgi:hypothetical protein